MKNRNEQGYALVTVLLIVTILMIIVLSVMGQANNTVLQNKKVEKKSQSTAIAEMGMSYYQEMIQNVYNAHSQTIYNQVKSDTTLKTNNDYAQKASTLMLNTIQSVLDNQTVPVFIDKKNNAYFQIETPILYDTVNHTFTLKVDGFVGNESPTTISTNVTIAPIASGASQSGGSTSLISITATIAGVLTGSNNISSIGILCIDPSTLDLETISVLQNALCSLSKSALITQSSIYNDNLNNKKLSNKTYYARYALKINGNINNMENVNIHSSDSLVITGNANSSNGSLIETVKDATFGEVVGGHTNGGQLGLDSSKMFVGGNLTVFDQLTLSHNSTVYVNNTATIAKNLTVENNSTLCVGGILNVSGQTFVKDTSRIILSGDVDFNTQCKNPNTSTLMIDWSQQLFSNVNYDY